MKTQQSIIIALAIILALTVGYNLKPEPAHAQASSANGYIAVKLDPSGSQDSGLAIINTEQKVMLIYKVKYGHKKTALELDAVRSFKFDEQLLEWKTEPSLREIEAGAKKAAAKRAKG